jgi:nucleoside-diphosphate-sugar epimerase
MMRLLITGGRGFVGRSVLPLALEAGAEIHATTTSPDVAADFEGLPIAWHRVDLRVPGASAKLIDDVRPTHVLHFAWIATHGVYWTSEENLQWLAATTEMIHAFGRASGERFILAGTNAEYDWTYGYLSEDTTPERPHTLYGTCKLAAHKVLMAAARQQGFSAATGRIFDAYGPHEQTERLIPYACRTLANGGEGHFSSGTQLRDFLHVSDIGRAFATLLARNEANGSFNISSGVPIPLRSIVLTVDELSGSCGSVKFGALPDRPDDPPLILGDNRKLRSLGWRPQVDLKTGLGESIAWWRRHWIDQDAIPKRAGCR